MNPDGGTERASAVGERRWWPLLAHAWYLLPLALVPWLVAGALAAAWLASSGPWLAPALRGVDPARATYDMSEALRLFTALLDAAPGHPDMIVALALGGAVVWIAWLVLQLLLEAMVASSVCLAKDGVAPRFGAVWDRAVDRYNLVVGVRLAWLVVGLALLGAAVALAALAWDREDLRARTVGVLTLLAGLPAVWLHLVTLLGQAAAVEAPLSVGAAMGRGARMGTVSFSTVYFGWYRATFVGSLLSAPLSVPAALLFMSQPSVSTALVVALVAVTLTALGSVAAAAYWTVVYRDLAKEAPAVDPLLAWAADADWIPPELSAKVD